MATFDIADAARITFRLTENVDAEIFQPVFNRHHPWAGTAAELRNYLTGENRDCKRAAEAMHIPSGRPLTGTVSWMRVCRVWRCVSNPLCWIVASRPEVSSIV